MSRKKRRSLKQRQNSLLKARNKAFENVKDLMEQGFQFSKSTLKAFESDSLTKKMQNANQADINYFKSLAKKETAYKKATSYVTDDGRKVSVKQGRLMEKRKNKQKGQFRNLYAAKKNIENIDSIVSGKSNYWKLDYSASEDCLAMIDDLLNDLDSDITSASAGMINDYCSQMLLESTQKGVDYYFNRIKMILQAYFNDNPVVASETDVSTIGTPFESDDDFEE